MLEGTTMLKHSPSRNLRSKGFKVKNALHLCLLLAICIWLLHQVKHSYDEKKVYKDGSETISEMASENESIKLGRKDVRSHIQQAAFEVDRQGEKGELKMDFDEVEEEDKTEGGGGGDDEIDGHDQEKLEYEESEEAEDLIDEADRVEDESEEQEGEGMGSHFEGESNSQAGEIHDKGEARQHQAELATLLEIQNWSK